MFGWSKGATATALVMGDDQRSGPGFDGPMRSKNSTAGGRRR